MFNDAPPTTEQFIAPLGLPHPPITNHNIEQVDSWIDVAITNHSIEQVVTGGGLKDMSPRRQALDGAGCCAS
jgi:hypothetical protein